MNFLRITGMIAIGLLAGVAAVSAAEPGPTTPATPAAPATPATPATPPGATKPAVPIAAAGPKTYAPINPNALNPASNDMALAPSDIFTPVIEEGEVLEFTITVSPTGMVAGKNLLKVQAIRPLANDPKTMVYDISSTIRSSRLFDMVYKVKIDVSTLMNVKEGFSQFYRYAGLEGNAERNERIEMDYSGDQAKAYYYSELDVGETHRDTRRTLALPGRVQDPLCALYALRGAKME
ncbi:MAG TPA: DUF3108 domain-containing protein, partial [Planctomycetota bacterium]|nr:DUF3108 domain-containing protein [Planctomycetota bacterium]